MADNPMLKAPIVMVRDVALPGLVEVFGEIRRQFIANLYPPGPYGIFE